ncbi:MAG: hypothetical protein HXY18_13485 [Bryobacteraceae bacterium]|nr:hypothetical protein [Bryobacteraceae bacterium]
MKLLRRTLLSFAAGALMLPAADPALLSLAPAGAKMIAGIDADRAKNSPFGQRLMAQIREDDKGFQEFLAQTGFDPRRDIREVVVAGTEDKKQGIILIRGTFDTAKIKAAMLAHGAAATQYQGVEIWSGGGKKNEGAIAILTATLAIGGSDEMVKAALDRRAASGPAIAPALAAKINDWSSRYDAWFVSTGPLGPNATKMGTLNGAANFSVDSILEAAAGARFLADIDVAAETVMRSAQDAAALADVIRFLASMVRMNAGQNGVDENVLRVIDTLQVSTADAVTRVSVTVPEQTLEKVFERKQSRTPRAVAAR